MEPFQQLFECLQDAVMIATARGSIQQTNAAAARLFEFAPDDLVGLPIEALLPAWRYDCSVAATTEKTRALGPHATGREQATIGQRQNGSTFPAAVSLIPLVVNDQPLVLYRVRDTTEWQELKEKLQAAQVSAERADRTKSEFLATMSHELLTPVSIVLGYAHVLLGSGLDVEHLDCANAILNAGRDLQSTINNILDFSTLEDTMRGPENRSFSLQEALEDVREEFAGKAAAKRLELALSIASEVPTRIVADSWRLRRILGNLIGNAIKFTNEGHIRVAVGAREVGERTVVRFAITDTGIGIPDNVRASLFQAFTQADMSATRRHGGSGLGLAVCRRLVECMDGSIGVDSAINEGSTFWFAIPVTVTATIAGNTSRTDVQPLTPESRTRTASLGRPILVSDNPPGARVLVAEDEPICQKITVRLLERFGCRVDVAADGAQAVEMSSRFDYDIILMDCHMPVLDGIRATREIRRREAITENRHTPIVALTASVGDEDRHGCYAAGMDAFINKPIKPKELGELVQRYAPRHVSAAFASDPVIAADARISANDSRE
jgi:PAS domain S-box-containing protein